MQNIRNNDIDIHIDCPNCPNWEEQPIDQQRHHLMVIKLVSWLPCQNDTEVSLMRCELCENEFKLLWDYDKNEIL